MENYASVPCVQRLAKDNYRVYFSGRDTRNRSQIGFFDFCLDNTIKIKTVSKTPILANGNLGSFDESGVMASWILSHDDYLYLYYIGWSLGVTVPFYNSIGLAISVDGGESFNKISKGPIIVKDNFDPFFTGSSCVLIDNDIWRMWYLSCVKWEMENGLPKHYYNIKYAESNDGVNWKKTGITCIDFKSTEEYSISRPSVIIEKGVYRMWYSFRGESYRIGYADSENGIQWERKDEVVGIDVSESGWDSQMIEYPMVFDSDDGRYMLYNGNGYGLSGIGLAKLMDEYNR